MRIGRPLYSEEAYWERKLPVHYSEILARAVSPVSNFRKRMLYYRLCWSILIDGGTQRIWIDRSTDKICLMVSAKALDITFGLDSRYWEWVSKESSRFDHAAELKSVECFQVWQRIDCALLTPETEYSVRFVLRIDKQKMSECPSQFTFSLIADGKSTESAICLDDFTKVVDVPKKTDFIIQRNGWTEFVAGEFVSKKHGESCEIEVCMKNTDSYPKSGIVIDGVKIEPK
ncbi:hypothetical protein SUGI_0722330 [Cryptomeria japonica]|uniref:F-box protein At2g02240-like n=1 Tax=Cryptomeria japonica TaxID=3369 RepID=UPI00241476EC|nr:F-box protein At2g02240-like [Cryptomeria japonica]GLJ36014.1 hypothetical protein SUGI_0722330 [Cryptomeria japonica]